MLRLGDSAAVGSTHFRHSSYVILSPFNTKDASRIRKASRSTRILAYKSAMDMSASCASQIGICPTGVSFAQAQAHDAKAPKDLWLARDSSGAPMKSVSYPDNTLADVGSASYRAQWAANVVSFLRAHHFTGVFIDNVLGDVSGWTEGRFPARYPTNAAWESAMAGFVATVSEKLHAKGFYVAVNAYKQFPATAAWWQRIAPSTDALMSESWEQDANTRQLRSADSPSEAIHWDYDQRLMRIAQDAGSSFLGLQYGSPGDERLMRYGRASFLLGWNGKDGAYIFNPTDSADPWSENWTIDVGRPLAPRRKVGSGWLRPYSGGMVVLNPSAGRTQAFALGETFVGPDGAKVSSVTLGPLSALILRRIGTVAPHSSSAQAPAVLRWDGRRFRTRASFMRWLAAHHQSWRHWARRYPAAARKLA